MPNLSLPEMYEKTACGLEGKRRNTPNNSNKYIEKRVTKHKNLELSELHAMNQGTASPSSASLGVCCVVPSVPYENDDFIWQ